MSEVTSARKPDDLLFVDKSVSSSLEYRSRKSLPIVLPWSKRENLLGSALDSQSILSGVSSPTRPSPFEQSQLQTPVYSLHAGLSVKQRSSYSNHASTLEDQMQFSGSLAAGNSFVGVSGKLDFEKEMQENYNTSSTLEQMVLQAGYLTFTDLPSLSPSAIDVLEEHGVQAFRDQYGDYLVTGMRLGLENISCLSSSADIDFRQTMKDVSVDGHVLGGSFNLYDEHEKEIGGSERFRVTASGFDTLAGTSFHYNAWDHEQYLEATKSIRDNMGNARIAISRVFECFAALDLDIEHAVPQQVTALQVTQMAQKGLVVELQLMPFSHLSDYIAASLSETRLEEVHP